MNPMPVSGYEAIVAQLPTDPDSTLLFYLSEYAKKHLERLAAAAEDDASEAGEEGRWDDYDMFTRAADELSSAASTAGDLADKLSWYA